MAQTEFSSGDAHTTDATTTEVLRWATPETGAVYMVNMYCVARQSSTGGRACFQQTLCVSNDNGTLTLVASETMSKIGNLAAITWALSASVDNNELLIEVNGATGQTVDWNVFMTGYQVGPF